MTGARQGGPAPLVGGFRLGASEAAAGALIASGWRVGAAFDADCTTCHGTGDADELGQCVCSGLLWLAPSRATEPASAAGTTVPEVEHAA